MRTYLVALLTNKKQLENLLKEVVERLEKN